MEYLLSLWNARLGIFLEFYFYYFTRGCLLSCTLFAGTSFRDTGFKQWRPNPGRRRGGGREAQEDFLQAFGKGGKFSLVIRGDGCQNFLDLPRPLPRPGYSVVTWGDGCSGRCPCRKLLSCDLCAPAEHHCLRVSFEDAPWRPSALHAVAMVFVLVYVCGQGLGRWDLMDGLPFPDQSPTCVTSQAGVGMRVEPAGSVPLRLILFYTCVYLSLGWTASGSPPPRSLPPKNFLTLLFWARRPALGFPGYPPPPQCTTAQKKC